MATGKFVDGLLQRFDELESQRRTTEGTWQDINDHLLGRAREFSTFLNTQGEQRVATIYDDTAKVSGSLLAGALHSLMTNPAARWFSLRYADEQINQIHEAAEWLRGAEDALFSALSRPEANFHAQLAETWLDLVFFGNGALFVQDKLGDGVRFSARPPMELYISEDSTGKVDLVIRKFRMSARQAMQTFGPQGLLERDQKALERGQAEEKTPYLHFVMPNDEIVPGMLGDIGMPWMSVFVSLDQKKVVSMGGFQEMPYAIARWQKETGEIYGRGPGWQALSDGKMLNEMKRVMLIAGQRAVDPPLLVDNEAVFGGGGQLRVQPGGVTPIHTATTLLNPPVQPLPFGGDFRISEALISDTRAQVQDAFHHQLIQVIRDPNMTATQVLELSAQMQRHLAPILGRMETELLEPVIERLFAIEGRAGRLPVPPPELEGVPLKIEYVSPVAKAQRTTQAQSMIQYLTTIANLSQVDRSALDIPDIDGFARRLADSFGVPPTLLRSPTEVEERRQAAAEEAQQDAQLQQLEAGASAAKDIGQAAKAARESQTA